jgi:hypothetical protein
MSHNKNAEKYLADAQAVAQTIRSWDRWRTEPLNTMRTKAANFPAASVALYAYYRYVRRFTLIMCSILGKVPEADERFWRLAINLYDELGAAKGFGAAHGKLLEGADRRPNDLSQGVWNNSALEIDRLERDLVQDFTLLGWPLNLFALGPGTESISDLFLDPIELWTSAAIDKLPHGHAYFDVHRPEVEYEHQMEISKVLSDELSSMRDENASSLISEGKIVAERAAERHYQATCVCWKVSQAVA